MMTGSEGLLETEGASLQVEGFQLKDLSVDDALEIFRNSTHPFFVFRNRATAQVNVVYQRQDGALGLLKPENE
jgi:putative sigma-54 modulation protein